MLQNNFLLISDPKIWAMPVKECGEKLVDLRHYDIQISDERAPFYDGYTKVRLSVAEKLMLAQKKLPHGFIFLFSEGHRPLSVQEYIYEDYYQQLVSNHPDWQREKLEEETSKYAAPPQDVPPHSTGGAIDITLCDLSGVALDMGSILDEHPDKNNYRNFTYAADLSLQAKRNRQYLIDVLTAVDFVNYPAEWWHWSYGDKYWAYHAKSPHAIYNSL